MSLAQELEVVGGDRVEEGQAAIAVKAALQGEGGTARDVVRCAGVADLGSPLRLPAACKTD